MKKHKLAVSDKHSYDMRKLVEECNKMLPKIPRLANIMIGIGLVSIIFSILYLIIKFYVK